MEVTNPGACVRTADVFRQRHQDFGAQTTLERPALSGGGTPRSAQQPPGIEAGRRADDGPIPECACAQGEASA